MELSTKQITLLARKQDLTIQKTEIMPCIRSDHNGIKLETNNKRHCTNTCRLKYTLLNDRWVIEEIREEILKFLESNENENTTFQNLSDRAKAVWRKNFIVMSAYVLKKFKN
jgi:hypothetical protein